MQKLFALSPLPTKVFSVVCLILFLIPKANAQDKHFTQFYASPLTLNPALTGAMDGSYRIGAIYRDQWRQVLDNPIKTFSMAADLRFEANRKKKQRGCHRIGHHVFQRQG